MLKIQSLENTTFEEIAETFNSAFSDYFFPVSFTREQLENKFLTEGGRPDLSAGIFRDEKLVAFILHFADVVNGEKIIYNGGTGVIPSCRGNHFTSKMYEFILPLLKIKKANKMVLEVLTENLPAIKTYQKQGFKIVRELRCFRGRLNNLSPDKSDDAYEITELTAINWDIIQSFWDYRPTWQNSVSVMNNLQKQNLCIGLKKDNIIIGYLIYNPKLKRIHQMAVDKAFRNLGSGSRLLNYIYQLEKDDVSFINIDSRVKNFEKFIKKRGLYNYTNQYEMEMGLK